MEKTYMLFYGEESYPLGGWRDFKGLFETVEAAEAAVPIASFYCDWWQIVDSRSMGIVKES